MVVREYHIKPWELDKLTARDRQNILLDQKAQTYIQEQQRNDGPKEQRSKTNSKRAREWQAKMRSDDNGQLGRNHY